MLFNDGSVVGRAPRPSDRALHVRTEHVKQSKKCHGAPRPGYSTRGDLLDREDKAVCATMVTSMMAHSPNSCGCAFATYSELVKL